MKFSQRFFKAMAVCAFLSGLTTLGVHFLPRLYAGPNEFERLVGLQADPIYIFRLWLVIFHILLVTASMWGVAARKLKDSAGPMILGFLGYLLFAAAELFRTSMGLFTLNRGWRAAYAETTQETVKSSLRVMMDAWPAVSDSFFFLLILGFLIGNLFYGLILVRGAHLERIVGIALLIWTAIGINTLAEIAAFRILSLPEWVSWTFQPAVRFMIAWWLWQTPAILIGAESDPEYADKSYL